MSIRNRPTKTGEARWYVRVFDPGRGRHVERQAGRTQKAARRVERQWRDQVDEHGTILELADGAGEPLRRNPTFGEWAPMFLEAFARRNRSYETAKSQMEPLVEFFGNLRLSGITPLQVAAFVRWCLERGHRRLAGRPIKPRTINVRLELLRQAWNEARAAKLVAGDNPVRGKDFLDEERRVVPMISEEQFRALLVACRPKRDSGARPTLHDFVLFVRYTGCRVGEALGLSVQDVDHRMRELTFRNTKNGDDRTLPLLGHIAEILERQAPVDGCFFGGERQRGRLRLAWERARARAGLDGLHLHDFRHLASTWMTAQGVDYVSNEHVLGHRVRGVFGRYTHPTREGLANALAALRNPFPSDSAVRHICDTGPAFPSEAKVARL